MNKITIITVCYNCSSTIQKTIESVLSQSYNNIEYIVVDGGSTDGTVDVINRYAHRIAKIISEADNGIYDAMNKGIGLSTGDWICFINSGDVFSNVNVLKSIFSNGNYEEIDVIYGNSWILRRGARIHLKACDNVDAITRYPIYRHGASFVKTETHKKYLFRINKAQEYRYALDYDQIFTMYNMGCKFKYVNIDILDFEEEGVSYKPFDNLILNYKITSQFGNRFVPILWYVYSVLTLVIKKILKR